MNAPDNIYIEESRCSSRNRKEQFFNACSRQDEDVYTTQYTRHDLYAAVEAERDELRRDHAAALRLVADLRFALGDDGWRMQPELIKYAKQLRARLDSACEWQPVAEAKLKNSEPVIAWQNGGDWREAIHFHGRFCYPGSDEEICGMTHIMRIKPPASAE